MIGYVDGSVQATTRRFQVVLEENAIVQLDDLVLVQQRLPDERTLSHYGMVTEISGIIEGADYSSDTTRISRDRTMPGAKSRTAEVQILRTDPELWIAPDSGAAVSKARGVDRERALFLDQMDQLLPIGLDQSDEPIFGDFGFMSGEKGGHVSISGVSGVATKTSYALFLLYMLFETQIGARLLGRHRPNTRAIVFNVKGEDLLHLDRTNSRFDSLTQLPKWQSLGIEEPGPFTDIEIFAPVSVRSAEGANVTDVRSRAYDDIQIFGWTPQEFIRRGLLKFCFADDNRTQVPFMEQNLRLQLARHAYPCVHADGCVVLADPAGASSNFDRVANLRRDPKQPGDGIHIEDFGDLVAAINDLMNGPNPAVWVGQATQGTIGALLRRFYALQPRLGQLIRRGVTPVELRRNISVVDLHALHDDAQRFVVGALLSEIFESKQGSGREPLRFIVLDELNKYAPREGTSPIKDVLIDIAARGRSLGVILIGAQQSASDVHRSITSNASFKVVGRLDAGHAEDYKFLSNTLRERASRFMPGTMIFDQPIVPAPIPFKFPVPPFATCTAEDLLAGAAAPEAAEVHDTFAEL